MMSNRHCSLRGRLSVAGQPPHRRTEMSQNTRNRAIALLIVALVVVSTVFAFMQAIGDLP